MLFNRKLLSKIKPFLKTPDIIVIHGARQTGKTSLLQLIQNILSEENCRYFDLRFKSLFAEGIEAVVNFGKQTGWYDSRRKNYSFVDEIQYFSNPSSLLKLTLDHHPEIKLIVSGSSSFEIKSKFKDTLTGRTVNFELFPLDFEEFLLFKGHSYQLDNPKDSKIVIADLQHLYREYVVDSTTKCHS